MVCWKTLCAEAAMTVAKDRHMKRCNVCAIFFYSLTHTPSALTYPRIKPIQANGYPSLAKTHTHHTSHKHTIRFCTAPIKICHSSAISSSETVYHSRQPCFELMYAYLLKVQELSVITRLGGHNPIGNIPQAFVKQYQ